MVSSPSRTKKMNFFFTPHTQVEDGGRAEQLKPGDPACVLDSKASHGIHSRHT